MAAVTTTELNAALEAQTKALRIIVDEAVARIVEAVHVGNATIEAQFFGAAGRAVDDKKKATKAAAAAPAAADVAGPSGVARAAAGPIETGGMQLEEHDLKLKAKDTAAAFFIALCRCSKTFYESMYATLQIANLHEVTAAIAAGNPPSSRKAEATKRAGAAEIIFERVVSKAPVHLAVCNKIFATHVEQKGRGGHHYVPSHYSVDAATVFAELCARVGGGAPPPAAVGVAPPPTFADQVPPMPAAAGATLTGYTLEAPK